ncbi:MAG TPA: alkaline phosphatase family protein [Acidimicrobiales bacterium]|nr:alkaline phosphatase family protein [Acidimicrobiales bacterium]
MPDDAPLLPDYGGACVANLLPALLEPTEYPAPWLPDAALDAQQVVLLVLDGMGWDQVQSRRSLVPTLSAMAGGPITTVLPSTTSTALTSITTGCGPGEHGIVGYRMAVHGEVLNVLRWATGSGDARQSLPPAKMQVATPFLGERPPVVTRAEYERSGFTAVHLDPGRFVGYRTMATMSAEVERLLRSSEPFVYAYYDGLDKVAHEYGLGEHYDSELSWLDILVDRILSRLPRHAALVVTADHGQVEVLAPAIPLAADVMANTSMQSGEGRFRWLHARPGRGRALHEACRAHHGDDAWVLTRDEMVAQGWFGPFVTESARARLGDVALVARRDVAFHDPQDTGPYSLIGRHGSATRAEMLVPLLVAGR